MADGEKTVLDSSTLGRQIYYYRIMHGLSRKKFGALIPADASTILAWEKGKHVPPKGKYKKIEEIIKRVDCSKSWRFNLYNLEDKVELYQVGKPESWLITKSKNEKFENQNERIWNAAMVTSILCYKIFYGLQPVAFTMDIRYAKIRISA